MKIRLLLLSGILFFSIAIWQNLSPKNAYSFVNFNHSDSIDFSSQVKPIINKHCISCHGGVKKVNGFGMLFRQDALENTKSGKPAIVPFHPEKSDFIARLTHADLQERMPYKADMLSKDEIAILTQWVKEGAKWGNHWAYLPPQKQEVPNKGFFSSIFSSWENNDIDYFVANQHKNQNLSHSKEADKITLLRRVAFDITGMPASNKIITKYQRDNSENWYENYIDELLKSPQYGERWASMWLDLARYSDSRGYQKDNGRNIWRYRDYVINSFNENKPFDQFTTEQLAGDLMPNPSENQLIATAFHRNTMNNDETGTVDEEYRVAAVIDRVNTTFDVWQGTTISCVQCHSHPYDPFRHEDYYKLMAYFNNNRDEDTIDEAPFLRRFEAKDKLKLDSLTTFINTKFGKEKAAETSKLLNFLEPRHHAHYADNYVNGTLLGDRNIGLRNKGTCRLPSINLDNKNTLLINYQSKFVGGILELRKGSPNGELLSRIKVDTCSKYDVMLIPIKETKGKHDLYLIGYNAKIKPEQDVFQISWFSLIEDFWKGNKKIENDFKDLINTKTENTPVMVASASDYERKTHVFTRGNWLVHGEEVSANVPSSMGKIAINAPKNRMGLAQWILDKNNPLTARTIVNRYWEQIFGIGLVETIEDFGTQGTKPSNQELLDFLAIKFRDDFKWKSKELIKYILMSATYKQQSNSNGELVEKDPQNRYFARGPRVRLSAEMVRDQALAVSGLLSNKMFGKPVMPYQTENIWQAVNSNLKYKLSEGEDQYRRAIYTFVRRTGPYPQQLAFDAPSREVCTQRRIRTNTPIQALQLLNDPVFMEASGALGNWMKKENKDLEQQISAGYKKIYIKEIEKPELEAFKKLYQKALSNSKNNESFALSIVANAMMNLDKFITKQ